MGLLKIAALQRGKPLLSEDVYSAIVMMVVGTTLITTDRASMGISRLMCRARHGMQNTNSFKDGEVPVFYASRSR
jgi:hypothetical protein